MRTLIVSFLFLAAGASAQDEFMPAHFGYDEEDRQLFNLIPFPEIKGDVTIMLRCFAQLETSGKMKNTACLMEDQFDQPFAGAVAQAAKKARMTPASINGKPVMVYVQFRTEFVAEGDDRKIKVILNPGYPENVAAYGEDHVAAQRLLTGKDEPWQKVCPQRAAYAVWAKAYVGEDGRADAPSIDHAGGVIPTPACQDAIKAQILDSRYIPAMDDGFPVPSTFVEIFSN